MTDTVTMFVSLRRAQTWRLHTKLYKFGWYTYANNARMKDSRDLILGEFVYTSIVYRIPGSWLNSFSLRSWRDSWAGEWRRSRHIPRGRSPQGISRAAKPRVKFPPATFRMGFSCRPLLSLSMNQLNKPIRERSVTWNWGLFPPETTRMHATHRK